jgi:predicted transcriptional regulator of viral defense system
MQPVKVFAETLMQLADREHYLFSLRDLHALLPELSYNSFKTLVSRVARTGPLRRLCRNLYIFERVDYPRDRVLFHAAARLRAECFNYLSLETVLSDDGLISQIPFSWITIMSSGRSGTIECDGFGTIEFIHTSKKPERLASELTWDKECRLWRASVRLALADMRSTKRPIDLVTGDLVAEGENL